MFWRRRQRRRRSSTVSRRWKITKKHNISTKKKLYKKTDAVEGVTFCRRFACIHTRTLYYICIICVYTYCVTYCQSNGENNHFDHSSFGTLSALYTRTHAHTRVRERGVSLDPALRPLAVRKTVFPPQNRCWCGCRCYVRGGRVFQSY